MKTGKEAEERDHSVRQTEPHDQFGRDSLQIVQHSGAAGGTDATLQQKPRLDPDLKCWLGEVCMFSL